MDRLRQKLEQYAPPPPPAAWASINDRLGSAADAHLRNRLADAEVMPPPQVWAALEQHLSGHKKAAGGTPVVRMQWLRIAVALILFVAGGWWVAQYVSNRNDGTTAKTEIPVPAKDSSITPAPKPNITAQKSNSAENKASTITKSNRYVTVANNGKTVRRSKKLQPLFDCAQLEEPGAIADCRKNLMDLQRKMASSAVNPTSDFAGLLDAIKTLEENR